MKLTEDSRTRWAVVSSSMRDDDTWDVIASYDSRNGAFRYIDDLHERYRVLRREGVT